MKRTLLAMVVVLTLGIGVGVVWGRHLVETREQGGGGTELVTQGRVATGDGRLSFDLPAGWVESACPAEAPVTCLRISPAGAGAADHIIVLVSRPEDGGNPYGYYMDHIPVDAPEHPFFRRLTIDGMDAIRIDPEQVPRDDGPGPPVGWLMMAGRVAADDTEEFLVSCQYDGRRAEVRASCDAVAGSLRLRR